MNSPSEDVQTELVDLSRVSLSSLRVGDRMPLVPSLARILTQVARNRRNLGGTTPPGRVD